MAKGAKFKKGQTVYMGHGDKMRKLVVVRVIKNPLIPIHQYTFEAPNDGFACGEQSIRPTLDGPDLKIKDCIVNDDSVVSTNINTLASGKFKSIMMDRLESGLDVGEVFKDSDVFFRPDFKFIDWLKDYANGRIILDIGAGQGHLVRMLKMRGAMAIGFEPNLNKETWLKLRMTYNQGGNMDVNEMMSYRIEDTFTKKFIASLGSDKALLVFARPCHSDFVSVGIRNMPSGMEALYITVPKNLELYNDMGDFEADAVKIEHEGQSEDNEVVYSVVRK
jgi:hypothetical protein